MINALPVTSIRYAFEIGGKGYEVAVKPEPTGHREITVWEGGRLLDRRPGTDRSTSLRTAWLILQEAIQKTSSL